ncbi:MAG TPA: quinone-dependent dihydroorotate dehydrogenase [Pseudonocardiaceae bacterium]|nr:quinone-dependent dihydroorotate dehydrogenase [Pseudonocardiaceae bacterium]
MLYSQLLRRVLFRLGSGDPEIAHQRTIAALSTLGALPGTAAALRRLLAVEAPRTVFGLRFPNPVGLAAGMDKNGVALPGWAALGFGHVEVGTVTWHAQPGNPLPRLYRLPASEALINRMGFNNAGARALAQRLATAPTLPMPLGISIGKSKITPVAEAVEDYRASLRVLYPHGDYFAVNVSSPNTPGLRGLQDRSLLDELLGELTEEAGRLAYGGRPKPVLVKIAPDLDDAAIGEVIEVCAARSVAGIIATNTTLARNGLSPADAAIGTQTGGLSGRPLARRALAVVEFVHRESAGRLPIIGVGGIAEPEDGLRMLDAGASLVQVYTGFIYAGPGLVRGISRAASATGAAPDAR